MTISSAIPASGTIISTGATLTFTNTLGSAVVTITLNRSGTGGSNEVIYSDSTGYDTPYTGSKSLGGSDETFTFRRNAGWDSSPFQIDVTLLGGTTEQLTYILVAEGEYPPDMQPFNDPIEGGGGGGTTLEVKDSGASQGFATALNFGNGLDVTSLPDSEFQVDGLAGPSTSADNAVARWDGGSGGTLDSSDWRIDDGPSSTLSNTDGNINVGGAISATGFVTGDGGFGTNSGLYLTERAAAGTPSAGVGQVWTKDESGDTRLIFTDDAGVDYDITQSGAGSAIEVVDETTSLTTGVTKFTFTGAGVTASEPVADSDEVVVTIDGAAVPAANLAPIIETGTGTPNNDVNVPSANPIILRDNGATLTPLSIERTGVETGNDDPALKITTVSTGSPIVLVNSTSSTETRITHGGIVGNGGSFGISSGTDTTGIVYPSLYRGVDSTTASTKGGDLRIAGGNASGTTSDGGDVWVGGGTDTGGNDGDVRIGYPRVNEIDFSQGFTIQEAADHPVSPVATAGQLWVRSSDGKPIFTLGASGTDYDLTAGAGGPDTNSVFGRYSSAQGTGTPAAGEALFNLGTFATTTSIKIDRYDADGALISQIWGRMHAGDSFYICDSTDRSVGANYVLDSAPTLTTNHYVCAVTVGDANGNIPSEVEIWPVGTNALSQTWLALTDTDPAGYSGQTGKYVRVNSAEDGLEFATPAGAGDVIGPATSVVDNITTYNNTTGDLIKDSGIAIGAIATAQTTANNALSKAGGTMTGNITMAGAETVDGRDISADGTQLDLNTTFVTNMGLLDEGGTSFGAAVYALGNTAGTDISQGEFGTNNAIPSSVTSIRLHTFGQYNTGGLEIINSLQVGDWVVLTAANGVGIGGEPAQHVYRINSTVSTPATNNNQYTVVYVVSNGSVFDSTFHYSLQIIRRPGALSTLTDTSINSVASGDILKWDGADWVNVSGTAVNLVYDNTTSGLTATNTQAAIDEVEARVDLNDTHASSDGTDHANVVLNDTHRAIVDATASGNPHDVSLLNLSPGVHSQLELASVDSGTIFASFQQGQLVDGGGGFTQKTAIATTDKILLEETGGQKRWGVIQDIPGFGSEDNDLATDGINGIVDNQLAVGTGPGTAEYQTLPTGAVAFGGTTFTQAARADLSDASTIGAISSGAGAPGTTPSKVGDVYVDTTNDVAYVATGTASSGDWTDVSSASGSGINTGTEAARPPTPADGTFYYATDTQAFSYYDTSAWENVGIFPDDVTVEIDGVTGKLRIKALGVDTAQLADDGVTYEKMQNVVANNVLLGNNTAAGAIVDELTPAEIRTMINVEDGATAGGGVSASTGAGPPGSIPGNEGDIYVDTTADRAYIAVDNLASTDWLLQGTVDTSGTPVPTDFARFTDANTIAGRSPAEAIQDLGIDADITSLTIGPVATVTGSNTGDQTIELTGDVTGTGTGTFATTIAAGAVDVAMLANGTDGELITWSAAGAATTVPVGTATHVLTSNGTGAAPTFQAAPSAPTLSRTITIEDPVTSEDISIFFTPVAITITEIRAVIRGTTPSVLWFIKHGTDRSLAGAAVVTAGTTTTSQTTGSDVTTFDDATIVADSFVWLETTTVSGTNDELSITIVYTED